MARKPISEKKSASLSISQVQAAIPKVRRRLQELVALDPNQLDNETGGDILDSHVQKINATLRDIYGVNAVEYEEYSIETFRPVFVIYHGGMDASIRGNLETVKRKVSRGVTTLKTLLETLEEQAGGDDGDTASRTLRAYAGLDLHPEIARASSSLYQDGHYANSVEAAVKALNGLVRLRSGLEQDGTTLMERAFSPSNPVLRFNDLVDQSDKDEQKGFMYMFSGAVSGLRNPRAHGFIQDDPERALEQILIRHGHNRLRRRSSGTLGR
ncbi:TIGR02391 family protein [Bradyrhizobium quebecense]|uniref:TIGR02391 family protein n=1 Tax=Bradyrhizobium quebecense TaxID=2748629 RepID=A0A973WJ66_9BRAD|nr:TIGR02391 family protein [Bradyrhizobium quebecense]UGA41219.1 TIGR02391 family protein [Bradyrhizobium quebecense]